MCTTWLDAASTAPQTTAHLNTPCSRPEAPRPARCPGARRSSRHRRARRHRHRGGCPCSATCASGSSTLHRRLSRVPRPSRSRCAPAGQWPPVRPGAPVLHAAALPSAQLGCYCPPSTRAPHARYDRLQRCPRRRSAKGAARMARRIPSDQAVATAWATFFPLNRLAGPPAARWLPTRQHAAFSPASRRGALPTADGPRGRQGWWTRRGRSGPRGRRRR
mmetsp:Transcript_29342/g.94631  ORF Transcript_29342/g.94631 Transcript_29342/m.94631 type:complete len:219 (+) Transcript_29342:251-907(+)